MSDLRTRSGFVAILLRQVNETGESETKFSYDAANIDTPLTDSFFGLNVVRTVFQVSQFNLFAGF